MHMRLLLNVPQLQRRGVATTTYSALILLNKSELPSHCTKSKEQTVSAVRWEYCSRACISVTLHEGYNNNNRVSRSRKHSQQNRKTGGIVPQDQQLRRRASQQSLHWRWCGHTATTPENLKNIASTNQRFFLSDSSNNSRPNRRSRTHTCRKRRSRQ